ncbi:MAG: hypothetical protein IJ733_13390 [Lachnospiraceae bacterium]|nr:hypothetical protein [Lachnospiraceae bacterium]
MHYATIVTVEVEPNIFDEAFAAIAKGKIRSLEREMEREPERKSLLKTVIEEEKLNSTTFSCSMAGEVNYLLERYNYNTDDPEYLEFDDRTEEYMEEYANYMTNLIRFPNGRIYTESSYSFWEKYQIVDGKVCEKDWGPLKHLKRTKRCKRMQVRLNVPLKEYYKTLADYVEDEHGTPYHEEQEAYGYYYNPDGYFDWYQIGGRWPDTFLVKKECEEYGIADRSFMCGEEETPAPEGYRWTCAARKKDIEWQAMYDWIISSLKKDYLKWKEAFETKAIPEESYAVLRENDIYRYGDILYRNGETEEEYVKRNYWYFDEKYPICVYSYLHDGIWNEKESFIYDKENSRIEERSSFRKEFTEFLEGLSEETVLVRVDCHK